MDDFKVGDRVRLIANQDHHGRGLVGEIVCFSYGNAGIHFDKREYWMHNLGNRLREFKGWYVPCNKLELEYQVKPYDPTQGNEEDDV